MDKPWLTIRHFLNKKVEFIKLVSKEKYRNKRNTRYFKMSLNEDLRRNKWQDTRY